MVRRTRAVRMQKHLASTATGYAAQNKLVAVQALYPEARKTVEAYVFFSMMETLTVGAISSGRFGGKDTISPEAETAVRSSPAGAEVGQLFDLWV